MTAIRFCHHLPGTVCDACRTAVPLPPSTTLPYIPYDPMTPTRVPAFVVNTSPTIAEFNALVARVAVLERMLVRELDETEPPVECPECGFNMTLVRPGKHQCDVCEAIQAAVSTALRRAADLRKHGDSLSPAELGDVLIGFKYGK